MRRRPMASGCFEGWRGAVGTGQRGEAGIFGRRLWGASTRDTKPGNVPEITGAVGAGVRLGWVCGGRPQPVFDPSSGLGYALYVPEGLIAAERQYAPALRFRALI